MSRKKIISYKPVKSIAWDDESAEKHKYDWNEADCLLPDSIQEKITNFLKGPMSNWYPNINETEINKGIADYNSCKSSEILLSPGSDYAHEIILKYISKNTNARCLIIGPTYDNFRSTAETILEKTTIWDFWLRNNGLEDLLHEHLEAFDLVYICSPNNPTGDIISKNILERILNKNPKIKFLIDEAYMDFHLELSAVSLINLYQNLIISRTFSKAWGLASFRVGYIVTNTNLVNDLRLFGNIKHVNQFAKIALSVVLNDNNYMLNYISKIQKNRLFLLDWLPKAIPELISASSNYGNFILLEFNSEKSQEEFYIKCSNHSFYVRSLSHLKGFEKHIRLTIPTSKGLDILIDLY